MPRRSRRRPGPSYVRATLKPRYLTQPADLTLEELRRELLLNGTQFGTLAAALPEDAPLGPTAPHGNFGELHCRAWYIFERIHDTDHVTQFRTIRAAPDFPA